MQLTPPDNKEASLDPEKFWGDNETLVLMLQEYKAAQVKLTKENQLIRERFTGIAREADRVKLI